MHENIFLQSTACLHEVCRSDPAPIPPRSALQWNCGFHALHTSLYLLQLKACASPWSGCINVRCSVLQLHAWSYAVLQLGLANSIGVAAAMLLTVAAEQVVVLCCFAVMCLRKALGWLLSVAQCCSCAVVVCSLQLSACKSHRNGCTKDVHWSHGLCNPVLSFSLFGIFFLSSGSLHIPFCCHHFFLASICLELPSSSSLLLDIISFYWQDHQLQRPL